ncbi:hypothetical protein Tco_1410137 [Tanacetum coccineum]
MFEKNKSHNVERAETRETSEPGLVRWLLRGRGRIGVAGSLIVGYLRNLNHRYRGDNNMAALGVAAVIEEYPHESLTFTDAVDCEKYALGMFIYLFLYMDYMGFTCESKDEIWVTKGLLDEAKGKRCKVGSTLIYDSVFSFVPKKVYATLCKVFSAENGAS